MNDQQQIIEIKSDISELKKTMDNFQKTFTKYAEQQTKEHQTVIELLQKSLHNDLRQDNEIQNQGKRIDDLESNVNKLKESSIEDKPPILKTIACVSGWIIWSFILFFLGMYSS